MNLDNLLKILNYPEVVEPAVRIKIEKKLSVIMEIAETAYESETFDFLYSRRNGFHQLRQSSTVRQFAEQFEIIGVCNDSEQAFENIFGINLLG